MAVKLILRLLKWGIIIGVLVFLIHVWLVTKSYVFNEREIANLAKKYAGNKDFERSYKSIYDALRKKHAGHILPPEDTQWLFMNAGGWMGSMCILHASLTEYVLFFGSAVDTVGHSGRYWANISDTVLTGEFRQWEEGKLTVNVYKPGDTVVHVWGEATAVNFKAGTWMVEYGRGFIPSTLGFALSDTIFSTQDFLTMFRIIKVYSKAMFMEASYYVANVKELWSS